MKFWLIILLLPIGVLAQFKNPVQPTILEQTATFPQKTMPGLVGFDPAHLKVSHSYQMQFMSANGHSFSQGVYLNTLLYQFSIPLTVSVQWGIAHQPMAEALGTQPMMNNGPFLSNVRLYYQPKDNMSISLEVNRNPLNYYRMRPFPGW